MYKSVTKHQLTKELKRLKNEQNPFVPELCFVLKILLVKVTSWHRTKVRGIDHDIELKINFLSCVKHCMEYPHLTNLQIISVSNQMKKLEFHHGYNRFNQPKRLLIVILQHTPKFLKLLNQLTQLVPIFASVNFYYMLQTLLLITFLLTNNNSRTLEKEMRTTILKKDHHCSYLKEK